MLFLLVVDICITINSCVGAHIAILTFDLCCNSICTIPCITCSLSVYFLCQCGDRSDVASIYPCASVFLSALQYIEWQPLSASMLFCSALCECVLLFVSICCCAMLSALWQPVSADVHVSFLWLFVSGSLLQCSCLCIAVYICHSYCRMYASFLACAQAQPTSY